MENLRSLSTILAAAALAIVPMVSLADDDDRSRNNPPYQYQCGPYGNIYCTPYPRNGRYDRDDENDNDQGRNPHGCINPAGHERGWCKHHRRGSYYGNGNYNNGGYYGNAQIQGIITGVRGNTITILQGLTTINVDISQALQRGDTNGPLYATRSITAYGYYGNNGVFYAQEIR